MSKYDKLTSIVATLKDAERGLADLDMLQDACQLQAVRRELERTPLSDLEPSFLAAGKDTEGDA